MVPFSPSCGGAPSFTLLRGTAASTELSAGQAESILASSRDMSGPATGAEVVEQEQEDKEEELSQTM